MYKILKFHIKIKLIYKRNSIQRTKEVHLEELSYTKQIIKCYNLYKNTKIGNKIKGIFPERDISIVNKFPL